MECDEDKRLDPSRRGWTPYSLKSLPCTGTAQQIILPPSISLQMPNSIVEEGLPPSEAGPDAPVPSAASELPNKSVTFASPVKTDSPRGFYPAVVEEQRPTMDPCAAVSKRSSISNQRNINSDFSLSTRRRSSDHPVERLKRRTSAFSVKRLSSLPASAIGVSPEDDGSGLLAPQRSASTSSSKSLSDYFAFLRIPSKSKKILKATALSPTTAAGPDDLGDLPADRVALEGRINYHIGRLDRIKRRLADLNDAIQQESQEYGVAVVNLRRQGMDASVEDLSRQLQWVRQCRNGLRPSIAFHRGELDRIGRKRMEMDVAEGYEALLPAVYANLDGDAAWEQRFAG